MIESVELELAFVHELPPIRGLRKTHRGTWDEPDGGCDAWGLSSDPVAPEPALDYYSLLPPEARQEWALGALEADWKGFKAGSLVLFPREFREWTSNRLWILPQPT